MALFITNDAKMQENINEKIREIYKKQPIKQVQMFDEWISSLKTQLFDATLQTVVESPNGQIEFVVKYTKKERVGLHPSEEPAVGYAGLIYHPELEEWRLHS